MVMGAVTAVVGVMAIVTVSGLPGRLVIVSGWLLTTISTEDVADWASVVKTAVR
ncbi:MAG: hypothetical protein IAE79_25730 [Anaerolinea sp.]|nr:hypothetical protein [Anaerolinea sp.]